MTTIRQCFVRDEDGVQCRGTATWDSDECREHLMEWAASERDAGRTPETCDEGHGLCAHDEMGACHDLIEKGVIGRCNFPQCVRPDRDVELYGEDEDEDFTYHVEVSGIVSLASQPTGRALRVAALDNLLDLIEAAGGVEGFVDLYGDLGVKVEEAL